MLFLKKWVFLETPTQLFPCEYCEIFKNSFFHGTPPVAALRDANRSDTSYKNLLPNMHLFPVSTGYGLISQKLIEKCLRSDFERQEISNAKKV